eukprot:11096619-Ditylum_brightwellii.AAC.1
MAKYRSLKQKHITSPLHVYACLVPKPTFKRGKKGLGHLLGSNPLLAHLEHDEEKYGAHPA